MKTALVLPVLLASGIAHAGASLKLEGADYGAAIAEATTGATVDARPELDACVRNWRALSPDRLSPLAKFENASPGSLTMLLEVGGSGWVNYHFAVLHDGVIDSDGAPARAADLGALSAIVDKHVNDLRGDATSSAIDDNCYFLTVRSGLASRRVAIYGDPRSDVAGRLVSALLARTRPAMPSR